MLTGVFLCYILIFARTNNIPMKDKSRISLLIAFISLLTAIIATGFAFAAEYDKIAIGQDAKIVYSIIPAGGNIAVCGYERVFISAITDNEINVAYSKKEDANYSSTNTTAHFGSCKVNSEIVVRYNVSVPALRIKVVSIDMKHGVATLIVTKFWPYPNEVQIKEVDTSSNPETEPDKK